VHYFREGRIGEFVLDTPLILGHEAAGTIVAVGAQVSANRVGQRVSIEPQRPCRRCTHCRNGAYNLCEAMQFYATPPIHGAFAQYAACPADFAHPIPDTMSTEAAALCEPLSVGIAANHKARTGPGTTVLVAGAGAIGLTTIQTALAFGAAEVHVSDPSPDRRKLAEELGATSTVDPAQAGLVASGVQGEVFIDASGVPSAISDGIRALRPAGRAVLVGMGPDSVSIPLPVVQNRELELHGVFRYANTWPLAINLTSRGLVDLDRLVSARISLDNVERALSTASDPGVVKNMVLPTLERGHAPGPVTVGA
jgi:L-iditol 2-dehydrogenase